MRFTSHICIGRCSEEWSQVVYSLLFSSIEIKFCGFKKYFYVMPLSHGLLNTNLWFWSDGEFLHCKVWMWFGGSRVFTFLLQSADTAECGKLFLWTQISEKLVSCCVFSQSLEVCRVGTSEP